MFCRLAASYQEDTCFRIIFLTRPQRTSPPTQLQFCPSAHTAFVICDCTIEPGTRFRKQGLNWTLPQFHTPGAGDRWSYLVCIAFWQLYLARPLVQDLPWQPEQVTLTLARVQQGMPDIFAQIGRPTRPPQTRGNSPGWPKGKPRRRQRFKVVKKSTKPPNSAKKAA